MYKIKYILMAVVLLSLYSCKEEYYLFNDVKRIQFGPESSYIYNPSFNLADTTKNFTFYYEEPSKAQDTVFFDIYAIGGTSKTDRAFKLEQVAVAGVDNAVAGVHYKAFTDPSVVDKYVIKGGSVHTRVPVVLLRDGSLKSTTVTLKLQVADNENFELGEKNNIWRKIVFTDRLSQPTSWDATFSNYYFGKYSVVKHAFFIEHTGQKWDEAFFVYLKANMGEIAYWKAELKMALISYNNDHPDSPLKDENGDLVTLP